MEQNSSAWYSNYKLETNTTLPTFIWLHVLGRNTLHFSTNRLLLWLPASPDWLCPGCSSTPATGAPGLSRIIPSEPGRMEDSTVLPGQGIANKKAPVFQGSRGYASTLYDVVIIWSFQLPKRVCVYRYVCVWCTQICPTCPTSEPLILPTLIYHFGDLVKPKRLEPVESSDRVRGSKERVGKRGRG